MNRLFFFRTLESSIKTIQHKSKSSVVNLLHLQCEVIKYLNGFLFAWEKRKEYKNSDFKSVSATLRPYKDGANKKIMVFKTF